MSLDYTIPKRVPKWVVGFAEHLHTAGRVADPAVPQMALTWKQYEGTHWADFQARGKKRGDKKPKAKDGEGDQDGRRQRLRQKVRELRRIADDMASEHMSRVVSDLEALVE